MMYPLTICSPLEWTHFLERIEPVAGGFRTVTWVPDREKPGTITIMVLAKDYGPTLAYIISLWKDPHYRFANGRLHAIFSADVHKTVASVGSITHLVAPMPSLAWLPDHLFTFEHRLFVDRSLQSTIPDKPTS